MLMPLLTAVTILLLIATIVVGSAVYWITVMPGESWQGPPPALTTLQQRDAESLRAHIVMLSDTIGERNLQQQPESLLAARDYLFKKLSRTSLTTHLEMFEVDLAVVGADAGTVQLANVVAHKDGDDPNAGVVILGAHYDTVPDSPGANDNGSGLAALLVLADYVAKHRYQHAVRFVAFVNEEAPYFGTQAMGSLRHLQISQEAGETVTAMMSLETIGSFSQEPGSQQYPSPFRYFYPTTGNFVGLIGNIASRQLVHSAITAFREHASIASEGVAAPKFARDTARSDHYYYWQAGIPALMVTDTANFRYNEYHQPQDTSEVIDFASLAHVVTGLQAVIDDVAVRIDEEKNS